MNEWEICLYRVMIEKVIGGKVVIKFEKKNERIKIVKEDDIKKHTNLK